MLNMKVAKSLENFRLKGSPKLQSRFMSVLFQVMAFFSLGMVVVSTLTFILSTMEDQEHDGKETAFSKVLDVIDAGVIIYFTLVSIENLDRRPV